MVEGYVVEACTGCVSSPSHGGRGYMVATQKMGQRALLSGNNFALLLLPYRGTVPPHTEGVNITRDIFYYIEGDVKTHTPPRRNFTYCKMEVMLGCLQKMKKL